MMPSCTDLRRQEVYLAFEAAGRAPLAGMRRAPVNAARPPRKITHLKSTKLQCSYSSTLD